MFSLDQWKKELGLKKLRFQWWLQEQTTKHAPHAAYASLAAFALWPLAEAAAGGAIGPAYMALGGVFNGVSGSLLAEQIQRWHDDKSGVTQDNVAEWVRVTLANNRAIRAEIDRVVQATNALQLAQAQLSSPELRRSFLQQLATDVGTIDSSLKDAVTELRRTADATEELRNRARIEQDKPHELKHYLTKLIAACDHIDIGSLDEDYSDSQGTKVTLSDVYTSLYLNVGGKPLFRFDNETVETALTLLLLRHRLEGAEAHYLTSLERRVRDEGQARLPVTALEAVAATQKLVILGAPGGGKSTLVNHLAAEFAKRWLGRADKLSGWNGSKRFPIRIVLRRFAAWLPEKPSRKGDGLVWDYLKHLLHDMACTDSYSVIRRILLEQESIVFFDGLDEVRENDAGNKRTLIKQAILDFCQSLDKAAIVITCREYAYKKDDAWQLPSDQFPAFELSLFQLEQMQQFVQTWYETVADSKGWSSKQVKSETGRLNQALQLQAHLREIGQYPLLLTLMTQINSRDGQLPETRADLYERSIKLLLSHWETRLDRVYFDTPISSDLITTLSVSRDRLKGALAQAALQIHEKQELDPQRDERSGDIRKSDLREILGMKLGSFDKAEHVMAYVQERAGLLQARDNDTYTFPHRSFQEYLAAAALWASDEPVETIVSHVTRDPRWWREVYLLAAGQERGKKSLIAELIDELLPPHSEQTALTASIAERTLLAENAISDTDFLLHVKEEAAAIKRGVEKSGRYLAVKGKVTAWLKRSVKATELTARDRLLAGDSLAKLGDDRPGVSLKKQASGLLLPDIVWSGTVPAGFYEIGDGKINERREIEIEQPFELAKYLVTNAQFDCFVQAQDGYHNDDWWRGMPERVEIGKHRHAVRDLRSPNWTQANRPREEINWYEAVAFCRWLTSHLGDETQMFDLPHEHEWEVAARYAGNGRCDLRIYPWGNEITPNHANYDKTNLNQTAAVGIFSAGRQPELDLRDMTGNVWEWCRNKYGDVNQVEVDESNDLRALRGGSWTSSAVDCRAASRSGNFPIGRYDNVGFRLVRRPPSQGR